MTPVSSLSKRSENKSNSLTPIKKYKAKMNFLDLLSERSSRLKNEINITQTKLFHQMTLGKMITVKNLDDVEQKCQELLKSTAEVRTEFEADPMFDSLSNDIDSELIVLTEKIHQVEKDARAQIEEIERIHAENVNELKRKLNEFETLANENRAKNQELNLALEHAKQEQIRLEAAKEKLENQLKFSEDQVKIAFETIGVLRDQVNLEKLNTEELKVKYSDQMHKLDELNVRYETLKLDYEVSQDEIAKKILSASNFERKAAEIEIERDELLIRTKGLQEKFDNKSSGVFEMEEKMKNHYESKLRERDETIAELCRRCVDVETSVRSYHVNIEKSQNVLIEELETKIKSLESENFSFKIKSASLEFANRSLKSSLDEQTSMLDDFSQRNSMLNQNSLNLSEQFRTEREETMSVMKFTDDENKNLLNELNETRKYCDELKIKLNNYILNSAATLDSDLLTVTDDLLSELKQSKEDLEILLASVCDITKHECSEKEKNTFRNLNAVEMIGVLKKIIDSADSSSVGAPKRKRRTRGSSLATIMASNNSTEFHQSFESRVNLRRSNRRKESVEIKDECLLSPVALESRTGNFMVGAEMEVSQSMSEENF